MKKERIFPKEMQSSYDMIDGSYPNGIPDEEYLPLLKVLMDGMSYRGIAALVSDCSEKSYEIVYNDLHGIDEILLEDKKIADVLQKLKKYGYDEWRKE